MDFSFLDESILLNLPWVVCAVGFLGCWAQYFEGCGVQTATILGAVEEPGHYEFEHGARRENFLVRAFKTENFERAKDFSKSAKMYYKTAADKGHKGAIDALARLGLLDAIVNIARLE